MNENDVDTRTPFQDLSTARTETVKHLVRSHVFFDPVGPYDVEHEHQKRASSIALSPLQQTAGSIQRSRLTATFGTTNTLKAAALHRRTLASALGVASVFLCVIPLAYLTRPDAFPFDPLTESVVLVVGVGGSLFAALIAGFIGSRWWLLALLGAALDAVFVGFRP
jgi:hypothetical protein